MTSELPDRPSGEPSAGAGRTDGTPALELRRFLGEGAGPAGADEGRHGPFRARRMLLAGQLAEPVADALARELPELTTRVVAAGELSAADVAWADSYAGRRVPPNLGESGVRWFHAMTAGVDRVVASLPHPAHPAHPAHPDDGIILTRTVGRMPQDIGRFVLAHLLGEAWHLREYRTQQARAVWRQLPHQRLDGQRVAVLGTGEIGSGIAAVLRANGFHVVGVNTRGTAAPAFDQVVALADAGPHLGRCVAVVLALPLTPSTRGLVGRNVLDALAGAVLVNVGRGDCLVEDGLRRALEDGRVRHAVLDVFDTEPLPGDDWRWSHPGVTVTPHISGPTMPEDVVEALVSAWRLLAAGRRPPHTVDLARGY